MFVDPLLEWDVEMGKEDARDLFDLVEWEGMCITPDDIVFHQL